MEPLAASNTFAAYQLSPPRPPTNGSAKLSNSPMKKINLRLGSLNHRARNWSSLDSKSDLVPIVGFFSTRADHCLETSYNHQPCLAATALSVPCRDPGEHQGTSLQMQGLACQMGLREEAARPPPSTWHSPRSSQGLNAGRGPCWVVPHGLRG